MTNKISGIVISILTMIAIIAIQIATSFIFGEINFCTNTLSLKLNIAGLILLPIILFLLRKSLNQKSILITIVSVFVFQNLFLSIMEYVFIPEDISDDLSGIVVLPLLIISLIILGVYIDYLKNKFRQNKIENSHEIKPDR